jgi:pSer/pThr/pTyr-binding forkhead associated (FHA) protein
MPRLLTVSGSTIELLPNHSYLLGRSPDCDIVVEDVLSSRKHARLTVGGRMRVVFIEDLGSRNGTYINEERITERTLLQNGSGVRIGATVFLVSVDDREIRKPLSLVETGTEAAEWLAGGKDVQNGILDVMRGELRTGTDFSGLLATFSLIEVLQLLIQTRKSGTLHVALDKDHASIEVRDGEVLTAASRRLSGFEALTMLAHQRRGIFWLVEKDTPIARTIREPTSGLLLELCRAVDEQDMD